ncbi:ankyrin repeat domain-containing protein [Streptosporangiaceae bacterium NEAU-GS5]|nr:ankyrin repeat domain-containing protein [Streptosporangiaceae bacterium NEAU-GS5]
MTQSELLKAVASGEVARAAELLHPGGDLDAALNPATGATPLYRAAVKGDAAMVRLLLEYGADPNRASGGPDEGLPLCAAACWDHAETVQALLDGGADASGTEDDGWTPLLWAAVHGHLATADLLLDAGADPSAGNELTPLTAAADFGAYGIAWSLLEHGADPAQEDGTGRTALEIARSWLGADLERHLIAELGDLPDDWAVAITRSHAADGTELVSAEARGPGDEGRITTRQRGHAAIAALLEGALGVRVPVLELVGRAVPYRDVDDDGETWWAVARAVRSRADDETYGELTALCADADPLRREFAVDVLGQYGFHGEDPGVYADRTVEILRRMAGQETEPDVVRSVLAALAHHRDPRALPEVLALINGAGRAHTTRDAMALAAVLPPGHEEGLATLLALTEDPDPEVRDWATMAVADLDVDDPRVVEALVARLDDPDLPTAAEAVRGLAERADPRATEGIHRVLADSDDPYARHLARTAATTLGVILQDHGGKGVAGGL